MRTNIQGDIPTTDSTRGNLGDVEPTSVLLSPSFSHWEWECVWRDAGAGTKCACMFMIFSSLTRRTSSHALPIICKLIISRFHMTCTVTNRCGGSRSPSIEEGPGTRDVRFAGGTKETRVCGGGPSNTMGNHIECSDWIHE